MKEMKEEKTIRQALGEPTFGEKMYPILDSLEDAVLEHDANFPVEQPGYPDGAFRCVLLLFQNVAMEKMWQYQERLGMPQAQREIMAERFGKELRAFVLRYCDIATEKLVKNTLAERK